MNRLSIVRAILCLLVFNIGNIALAKTELLTLKLNDFSEDLKELQSLDIDIAGVDIEESLVDIIIHSATDKEILTERGYEIFSIKILDNTLTPESEYLTYDEMSMTLQNYAAIYPEISKIYKFGETGEGRPIWGMKISDNIDLHELDEPTILFNSMHHAREIMTVEVTMDMIEYLLTSYGSNTKVTQWIDRNEIWVIPMVNPDGNHKVWNGSSMWRKNTRGGYGVDLNRNYPHLWNYCNGSSGNQSSDTYRGPSAGSEPETKTIMNVVSKIQPVFDISYHAYSELVIYPYGCEGMHTATRAIVENVGKTLASKLQKDHSSGTYDPGTAWELLYSADGSDIDWMYREHQVIPYVIEISSRNEGFQPPYSWRNPTVEKQRAGWGYLLDRLEGSGIRGVVKNGAGRSLPGTTITVESLGNNNLLDANFTVKKDGTYHIILNPGMYKLTFDGNHTEEIIISENRIEKNIEL